MEQEQQEVKKLKRQLAESNLVLYRLIKSLEFMKLTPRQAKFYQQAEIVLKNSYEVSHILKEQKAIKNGK